jgi:hypothetical protein
MKAILSLAAVLMLTSASFADSKVGFDPGDTVASVLKRQTGQRVELRMRSGEKITGKVEAIGATAVHISALAGQEFFDAVVVLGEVAAVVIRTGGK